MMEYRIGGTMEEARTLLPRCFRCMGLAAAALLALWLGGCATGTRSVASLRDAPHKVYSFEVPADYRTVHERIVQRARQRYAYAGVPTRQPGVTTDLTPESQSAAITLWDSGGIGIRYLLSADIRAIDPARTSVDLYAAGKKQQQEARLWAAWADTPLEN
jgi:hypothetical protein